MGFNHYYDARMEFETEDAADAFRKRVICNLDLDGRRPMVCRIFITGVTLRYMTPLEMISCLELGEAPPELCFKHSDDDDCVKCSTEDAITMIKNLLTENAWYDVVVTHDTDELSRSTAAEFERRGGKHYLFSAMSEREVRCGYMFPPEIVLLLSCAPLNAKVKYRKTGADEWKEYEVLQLLHRMVCLGFE